MQLLKMNLASFAAPKVISFDSHLGRLRYNSYLYSQPASLRFQALIKIQGSNRLGLLKGFWQLVRTT